MIVRFLLYKFVRFSHPCHLASHVVLTTDEAVAMAFISLKQISKEHESVPYFSV